MIFSETNRDQNDIELNRYTSKYVYKKIIAFSNG